MMKAPAIMFTCVYGIHVIYTNTMWKSFDGSKWFTHYFQQLCHWICVKEIFVIVKLGDACAAMMDFA